MVSNAEGALLGGGEIWRHRYVVAAIWGMSSISDAKWASVRWFSRLRPYVLGFPSDPVTFEEN